MVTVCEAELERSVVASMLAAGNSTPYWELVKSWMISAGSESSS